jgi:DNA-binding response OmpR family regulator
MGMIFENKLDIVLVIDDEPFHTDWLTDYFISQGLNIENEMDLQGALKALETTRYRYVVIDLSIPFNPALAQPLAELGTEFYRYPGLMAARRARSTGHNTYQVIVYSAHDSDEVQKYADKIRCRYMLKGRPRELKSHIESHLNRSPHGWLVGRNPAKAAVVTPVRSKPKASGAPRKKPVKKVIKKK